MRFPAPTRELLTNQSLYYGISIDKERPLWRLEGFEDEVNAIAFALDNATITTGSRNGKIHIRDASAGDSQKVFFGHTKKVTSITFASDDRRIVSGSEDRTVRIWDAETGEQLARLQGHTGPVQTVAYRASTGHVVSAGRSTDEMRDNTLRVWQMQPPADLVGWTCTNRYVQGSSCPD